MIGKIFWFFALKYSTRFRNNDEINNSNIEERIFDNDEN